MPKFNDLELAKWKESDVWTDSLWLIEKRDTKGKHSNFYHGNFVPQIPYQLISRYTKKGETVLDPFVGSGTTAFEAEALERNFIGIDLQDDLVESIKGKLDRKSGFLELLAGDTVSKKTFSQVREFLARRSLAKVQFAILHPPYADIVKFSDSEKDLSNCNNLDDFLGRVEAVLENVKTVLENNRYMALVMGDMYKAGKWIPLGFECMQLAIKKRFELKSIVVKNIQGNRGKLNKGGLWRYRALASDYYLFKHEYIFIFKNKV